MAELLKCEEDGQKISDMTLHKEEHKSKTNQKQIQLFENELKNLVKKEVKKVKKVEQRQDIYFVLEGEFVALQTLIIRNKAQGGEFEQLRRSRQFLNL